MFLYGIQALYGHSHDVKFQARAPPRALGPGPHLPEPLTRTYRGCNTAQTNTLRMVIDSLSRLGNDAHAMLRQEPITPQHARMINSSFTTLNRDTLLLVSAGFSFIQREIISLGFRSRPQIPGGVPADDGIIAMQCDNSHSVCNVRGTNYAVVFDRRNRIVLVSQ